MDRLHFDRPIFIIAAPRSGSTMLFEALARHAEFWTLGGEAHAEFEAVEGWHPRAHGYDSNRLAAADASSSRKAALLASLSRRLRRADGVTWRDRESFDGPADARFLEKTPKNAVRVPLIKALFPDARFIFLVREPRGNVASIIDAWRSGRFVTYRHLPGWPGLPWSMLLPPGWRELKGAPLERIAAFQWRVANEIALSDLNSLPASDWRMVSYDDLVADPAAALASLDGLLDLSVRREAGAFAPSRLPPSRSTLTLPHAGKWRRYEQTLAPLLGALDEAFERVCAAAAVRG